LLNCNIAQTADVDCGSLALIGQNGSVTYELRTYVAVAGRYDALLARFRDHTVAIFAAHGMTSVAYWTPVDEPLTLVYVLRHDGLAEDNWAGFKTDPAWIAARDASTVDGEIIASIDSVLLEPTDFSALQ
jgi:hypothetical protein